MIDTNLSVVWTCSYVVCETVADVDSQDGMLMQ